MTQEDKELLLKDLCARLPYRPKLFVSKNRAGYNVNCMFTLRMVNVDNDCDPIGCYNDYGSLYVKPCEVKPYLFPLSSMTLEQRCKVTNFVPNNCEISFKKQKITFYDEGGSVQLEQLEKILNFFNLYHFDYRGLIEKGLAIDATGLNIY